jgi:hypothetical protein
VRFMRAWIVVGLVVAGCGVGSPSRSDSTVSPMASTPSPTGTRSPSESPTPASRRDEFVATGSMLSARHGYTATLLQDGRVLIVGGEANTDVLASTELYDPGTGSFSAGPPMRAARLFHTATLLRNGLVLVAGGNPNASDRVAELFDPATDEFRPTGQMVQSRMFASATLLVDGRVLVVGGLSGGLTVASAEIFDPATGTFSPTGSMSVPREQHIAALLSDGRILIAGGDRGMTVPRSPAAVYASAEIYDPSSGEFSPAKSMKVARSGAACAVLPSGQVLVVAGEAKDEAPLDSAEVFDPITGEWSQTEPLASAVELPLVVVVNAGSVLIIEGDATQLFDANTGRYQTVAAPPVGSPNGGPASASVLADGRVLVGYADSGLAFIYYP